MNPSLETYLEGSNDRRGLFVGYKEPNKKGEIKKNAIEQKQPINWNQHFEGISTYGLSPIRYIDDKPYCKWIGFDLDKEGNAEKVVQDVLRVDPEFIVYLSSTNRFHLHKYLDKWTPLKEVKEIAAKLEKKLLQKFKGDLDTGHTVPCNETVDQKLPGYWLFMPYSPNKELKPNGNSGKALSARGETLSKSQCEFKIKWRKHHLISQSVGARAGMGGREKMLFIAYQVIKHNNLSLTIEEVNNNFSEPLTNDELRKELISFNKKDESKYTKEYLESHYDKYWNDITGFWLTPKGGLTFTSFEETEEEKENKKVIFDKVIYIAQEDRWYDKSTGYKAGYKTSAIKTRYGGYFKRDFVKEYSSYPDRQEVELSVYRPDLYIPDEPIIVDEEGLKQLNSYQPSKLEAIKPSTMDQHDELDMFKDLVRKLTEKEYSGTNSKGEEIDLNKYILDFLSYPFQHAGTKIRSAPFFHSKFKQLGKTTLSKIMVKALGADNATIITAGNALSRERSFIENQFVLIDEIRTDGSIDEKRANLNVLKPMMTDELIDCRPLFKDWRRVHSIASFILNTNYKDAVAIDVNEERYTCIDVGKNRAEMGGDEFYKPLYKAFKTGTLANVVKHYLSTRKISDDFDPNSTCLKTKWLHEMAKAGGHPVLADCEVWFKEGAKPFDQPIISIRQAWEYLKKEKGLKCKLNDFSSALLQLNAERVGECRHNRSGLKPTLYIISDHKFFMDKTKSEMVNKYWLPIGNSTEWNLSAGDLSIIQGGMEEINAFRELISDGVEPTDIEEREDVAFEEVRKARTKSRLGDLQ